MRASLLVDPAELRNSESVRADRATDYAVNPILINNGITLPKDALIDPAFADLGAEEIYARLLNQGQDSRPAGHTSQSSVQSANCGSGGINPSEQAAQHTQQKTQSAPSQLENPELAGLSDPSLPVRSGRFGEVLDAVGEDGQPASQAELSQQMHEWAINAEQALCSTKASGHEPGGIERPLYEAQQWEHDWRVILRDFITATSPDYRWAPPNRRFISSGLYLPSVERSGVGDVVIAVDISGSIGTKELEQFAGEINAIASEAQPESNAD